MINDTFGHDVGDDVLAMVASTISLSVREIDIAGRWGGEEFLIICPKTDFDQVKTIAHRIHQAIRHCEYKKTSVITASLGITMYEEKDSLADIIKRADLALYQAKNSGKNCVRIKNTKKNNLLELS